MRHARLRLLAVALLALSGVGSSAVLCLCPWPAAATPAHGCCEEDAGLVPGDMHCCQDASPAPARPELIVRAAPLTLTHATVLPADGPPAASAAPPPARPGPGSLPAIVLRV